MTLLLLIRYLKKWVGLGFHFANHVACTQLLRRGSAAGDWAATHRGCTDDPRAPESVQSHLQRNFLRYLKRVLISVSSLRTAS